MDPYVFRTLTFWSFVGLSLICLAYPWRLRGRLSRWALHLPVPLVPLVALHEWGMPDDLTLRPDLLAIITLGGPTFAAYCFRLCLVTDANERRDAEPKRLRDLSWSERRSLLPFNDEPEAEQLAKLNESRRR